MKIIDGDWGQGTAKLNLHGDRIEITTTKSPYDPIHIDFGFIETIEEYSRSTGKDASSVATRGAAIGIAGAALVGPLAGLAGAAYGAMTAKNKSKVFCGILTKDERALVLGCTALQFQKIIKKFESGDFEKLSSKDIENIKSEIRDQENKEDGPAIFGFWCAIYFTIFGTLVGGYLVAASVICLSVALLNGFAIYARTETNYKTHKERIKNALFDKDAFFRWKFNFLFSLIIFISLIFYKIFAGSE